VVWAEYNQFSAEASRLFSWTVASEPLRLVGLDRVADNRVGLADLACVLDALVETDAFPRCRFRHAGPNGSRAHGAPANESTRALDRGHRQPAVACAIFLTQLTERPVAWANSRGEARGVFCKRSRSRARSRIHSSSMGLSSFRRANNLLFCSIVLQALAPLDPRICPVPFPIKPLPFR
jgi:hypothetical protein